MTKRFAGSRRHGNLRPRHLSLAEDSLALNPDLAPHITRETPPTFLLQNQDDDVDRVEHSLSYYAALKKAGVKAAAGVGSGRYMHI